MVGARLPPAARALRLVGLAPNLAHQFPKLILDQATARLFVPDGHIFDLGAGVLFGQRQSFGAVLYSKPRTVFIFNILRKKLQNINQRRSIPAEPKRCSLAMTLP